MFSSCLKLKRERRRSRILNSNLVESDHPPPPYSLINEDGATTMELGDRNLFFRDGNWALAATSDETVERNSTISASTANLRASNQNVRTESKGENSKIFKNKCVGTRCAANNSKTFQNKKVGTEWKVRNCIKVEHRSVGTECDAQNSKTFQNKNVGTEDDSEEFKTFENRNVRSELELASNICSVVNDASSVLNFYISTLLTDDASDIINDVSVKKYDSSIVHDYVSAVNSVFAAIHGMASVVIDDAKDVTGGTTSIENHDASFLVRNDDTTSIVGDFSPENDDSSTHDAVVTHYDITDDHSADIVNNSTLTTYVPTKTVDFETEAAKKANVNIRSSVTAFHKSDALIYSTNGVDEFATEAIDFTADKMDNSNLDEISVRKVCNIVKNKNEKTESEEFPDSMFKNLRKSIRCLKEQNNLLEIKLKLIMNVMTKITSDCHLLQKEMVP